MNKTDLEEELRMERKALHHLRIQNAKYGISTPPHVLIDIEDAEKRIARLQAALENLPGDEQ